MHTSTNGVDCSEDMKRDLSRYIEENSLLVSKYDPNGQFTDGNIEIGSTLPEQLPQIFSGQAVSFSVSDEGEALDIRVFPDESTAMAHASSAPGRLFGIVGMDNWSIMPEETDMAQFATPDASVCPTLVYALIQEMPNGWWKGLISGWHDLPEQFEPGHDRIISEMTAVAREYIRERRERGIAIRPSTPIQHHGWQLVPISVD